MEPVGAKRIWERSEEKNNLRYTEFYGDGESFTTVRETYTGIHVKKLECVVSGTCKNELGVACEI